ncbi:hypothetical protein KDK77_00625 [bacterium]|nr:hypothetical protein [bacterium]MCP5462743.1 hypothetical protein [bacterium]
MKRVGAAITIVLWTLCLCFSPSMSLHAMGKKHTEQKQTLCPDCSKPIDLRYYVDFLNKRIFCCGPDCHDKIAENPEKYVRILQDGGITLEDVGK